jgi:4-amino-4-deoxy-L-arabinose transferase-like glycosyltransferase
MMKFKPIYTVKQWWESFEEQPQNSWGFSLLWLLVIGWLAFLWNLGSTGLVDETEPLFAEAARQMTVTGDWITPYFNGETRFDKPILIYWLMAIGYQLVGVNTWAVRLPSALAAIALTILCFFTLRYFGFATPANASRDNRRTQRQLWFSAWIGSAAIAFNLQAIVWARQGVSDMLLSGCMGGSLLCFFWGYAKEEQRHKTRERTFSVLLPNRWYLFFYILSALAVLTKGPVGIVLPGLIITTFLLYIGRLREVLWEMGAIAGGLIFAIIAFPWYILVILRNGSAFINSFLGYHNVDRFIEVVNGHRAPWYFYFLVVLIGFFPWSIYLPLAIVRLRFWKRAFWCQQPRSGQLSLFALFWFAGVFLFFTMATTKLPSYVLPLIPAAAILVALVWSQEWTDGFSINTQGFKKKNGLLISALGNILVLGLLTIIFVQIPHLIGNDPAISDLPELLETSRLPLIGSIIWLMAAITMIFLLRQRRQWRWLVSINILAFVAFIILVLKPTTDLIDRARQQPLREIAAVISQVKQPQEELIMIGFKKPSIVFYSQHQAQFLRNKQKVNDYLRTITETNDGSANILMLGRKKDFEKFPLQPQDYQFIAQNPPYQLIRIAKRKIIE